ncbi:MAG TPA: hypothetical protein VFL12_07055, partial [Thermoanaerobaculia bacterium]|nr:hypothetical protein [Thermoanaerobaculia bacterium]
MNTRNRTIFLAFGAIVAGAAFVAGQSAAPAPPSQTSTTQVKTPVKNFEVQTSADYLGTLDGKTVVRIRLTSAEIARALAGKGIGQYSMTLKGSIRNAADV